MRHYQYVRIRSIVLVTSAAICFYYRESPVFAPTNTYSDSISIYISSAATEENAGRSTKNRNLQSVDFTSECVGGCVVMLVP